MAYIGRTPTNSILTGADIADGSISTAKIADTAVSTAKIADDAVGTTKLNLASDYAFTGTVTGAGKLINSSRIIYTAGDITFNNGSTLTDSGIDHNYTASSTSNNLIHIINVVMQKTGEGGQGGGVTIYADDSAITEINGGDGALARMHQDSATSVRTGNGSFTYHQTSSASTSQIKYSIYVRGDTMTWQLSSGEPLIWTILEVSA